MQQTRQQVLFALCCELRELVGSEPRLDPNAREQSLALLTQLRNHPYASLYTHRCTAALVAYVEQWFTESAVWTARKVIEHRELIHHQLALLETEQRLRSWLIESYGS